MSSSSSPSLMVKNIFQEHVEGICGNHSTISLYSFVGNHQNICTCKNVYSCFYDISLQYHIKCLRFFSIWRFFKKGSISKKWCLESVFALSLQFPSVMHERAHVQPQMDSYWPLHPQDSWESQPHYRWGVHNGSKYHPGIDLAQRRSEVWDQVNVQVCG